MYPSAVSSTTSPDTIGLKCTAVAPQVPSRATSRASCSSACASGQLCARGRKPPRAALPLWWSCTRVATTTSPSFTSWCRPPATPTSSNALGWNQVTARVASVAAARLPGPVSPSATRQRPLWVSPVSYRVPLASVWVRKPVRWARTATYSRSSAVSTTTSATLGTVAPRLVERPREYPSSPGAGEPVAQDGWVQRGRRAASVQRRRAAASLAGGHDEPVRAGDLPGEVAWVQRDPPHHLVHATQLADREGGRAERGRE